MFDGPCILVAQANSSAKRSSPNSTSPESVASLAPSVKSRRRAPGSISATACSYCQSAKTPEHCSSLSQPLSFPPRWNKNRCVSDRPFALDDELECEIMIPGDDVSSVPEDDLRLRCRARVVRVVPQGKRQGFGIACRLDDFTINRSAIIH